MFAHAASLEDALRRAVTAARRPFQLAASVQTLAVAFAIASRTDALALVTRPIAQLFAKVYAIQALALPPQVVLPAVPVCAIWHE